MSGQNFYSDIFIKGNLGVSENINAFDRITGNQLVSTVTGTIQPLIINNTTLVTNLNSDLLDGKHGSYYLNFDNLNDKPNLSGTGLTFDETSNILNHTNSITAGTISEGGVTRTLNFGETFNIPSITYDSEGHITTIDKTTLTLPDNPEVDNDAIKYALILGG